MIKIQHMEMILGLVILNKYFAGLSFVHQLAPVQRELITVVNASCQRACH